MFRGYDIIYVLKGDQILRKALNSQKMYDLAFFLIKDYISLIQRGYNPIKNRDKFIDTFLSRTILAIYRARKVEAKIDLNILKRTLIVLLDRIKRIDEKRLREIAFYYNLCKDDRKITKLLSIAGLPRCQT